MFFCTYEDCGATFKKRWRLVEHLVHHTGEKPFSCSEEGCNKAFSRKSHLQRHVKSHSGSKNFECQEDGCGQKFVSNDNLKKHLKRVHQERIFKCTWPDCGKTFRKHQQLKYHTCQHTNTKPHSCDHEGCGKSFQTPSKLKSHKKTHEGYSCDFPGCDVVVYKWTLMRKHKAEAHKSTFQCRCCEKVFKSNSRLKSHMKIHDSVRDVFECPYEDCHRLYAKLASLKLHVNNYHEGARPYACSHEGCVKTFAHRASLLKHQVVHAPGYCKPPANPKRKRSLASRLSGHPDGPSRMKCNKKSTHSDAQGENNDLSSMGEANSTMTDNSDVQSSVISTKARPENEEILANKNRKVSESTGIIGDSSTRVPLQSSLPDPKAEGEIEKCEQIKGSVQNNQKALTLISNLTLTISNDGGHHTALEQERISPEDRDSNMNRYLHQSNFGALEGKKDPVETSSSLSQSPSTCSEKTEQVFDAFSNKECPKHVESQFDGSQNISTVQMRPDPCEENELEVVKRLLNLDYPECTLNDDVSGSSVTEIKDQTFSETARVR